MSQTSFIRTFLLILACSALTTPAFTIPLRPITNNDDVEISYKGRTCTLNAKDGAILEYDKFTLTQNETLSIVLPSSESTIYIRILSDYPTSINGTITSNGSLFLLNHKGISIDDTAEIIAPELFIAGYNIIHKGILRATFPSGKGGRIFLTANNIQLTDYSVINSSGQTSGGQIFVGGGWNGSDPAIPNAETTIVDDGATLFADSLSNGDGGMVIIWSNTLTSFKGNISATGRGIDPTGGYAQVKSSGTLIFEGHAILNTDRGSKGTLDIQHSQ